MSTLQVSTAQITTISDGSNSTSSTNAILGSAKAWVNFNGTTSPGTIRASFNVSSVSKNATGDYSVNFTNALADANYSVVCGSTLNSVGQIDHIISTTSSACRFQRWDNSTGTITSDATIFTVSIFR